MNPIEEIKDFALKSFMLLCLLAGLLLGIYIVS